MTTRINLLPWRDIQRKEQDRQLLSLGIFAWMLMGLVVFYAHLHMTGLIDAQNDRNKYLTTEISKLNKTIKEISSIKKRRKALLERMNVIYKLQTDRTRLVHLMDGLVKTLPDGVYYTSLKQRGSKLSLKGDAQSNARVSALLRNFANSKWFNRPHLGIVKTRSVSSKRVSTFSISVTQRKRPKKVKADSKKDKNASLKGEKK